MRNALQRNAYDSAGSSYYDRELQEIYNKLLHSMGK